MKIELNASEINIVINSILILQTEQQRIAPGIRKIDPTQVDTGVNMVEALLRRFKKLREDTPSTQTPDSGR